MKHTIAHFTAPNQPVRVKVFAAVTSPCVYSEGMRAYSRARLLPCVPMGWQFIQYSAKRNAYELTPEGDGDDHSNRDNDTNNQ